MSKANLFLCVLHLLNAKSTSIFLCSKHQFFKKIYICSFVSNRWQHQLMWPVRWWHHQWWCWFTGVPPPRPRVNNKHPTAVVLQTDYLFPTASSEMRVNYPLHDFRSAAAERAQKHHTWAENRCRRRNTNWGVTLPGFLRARLKRALLLAAGHERRSAGRALSSLASNESDLAGVFVGITPEPLASCSRPLLQPKQLQFQIAPLILTREQTTKAKVSRSRSWKSHLPRWFADAFPPMRLVSRYIASSSHIINRHIWQQVCPL